VNLSKITRNLFIVTFVTILGASWPAYSQTCLNYDGYTHITFTYQDNQLDALSNTPQKVSIDGDWAIVAIDQNTPGGGVGGWFTAIDITNPSSPVAHTPTGVPFTRTRDFAIANDHLVVMGSESGGGGYSTFLDCYDVSNPTAWTRVAHLLDPGSGIYTSLVSVTDSHAYLLKYGNTILVHSMPNLTPQSSFAVGHSVQRMFPSADGAFLFILGDGDLQIYSLADPVNPQWVAKIGRASCRERV